MMQQGQEQTRQMTGDTGQDIMLYTGRCTDQDADSRQQTADSRQMNRTRYR